ncbi:MAG: hypothetical protein Tsb0013_24330 [Phycisphaerales bacterium]
MPKAKPHKSLLKRLVLSKTGKARHTAAGYKHLRSAKTADRKRRLRRGSWVDSADTKRLSRMIFTRLRGKQQPKSAITRSPNPDERASRVAEARERNKAAREAFFADATS